MIVQELIKELQQYDANAKVALWNVREEEDFEIQRVADIAGGVWLEY